MKFIQTEKCNTKIGYILKSNIINGYHMVKLYNNRKLESKLVHVLVIFAFQGILEIKLWITS